MRVILLCLLLVGCGARHPYLAARSELLDSTYLASSQVKTPDPCTGCFKGEQVIVNWSIPYRCFYGEMTLGFSVRYGNQEVESTDYTVPQPAGYWIFRVLNADFRKKKGIESYSVKLYRDGVLLDQFDHHLWTELIEI